MKIYFSLVKAMLVLLLGSAPFLVSESRAQSLLFKESSADLGTFSSSKKEITHRFVFKNVSANTLKISSINSDCACSTAAYAKKPVFPDATDTLEVTFLPYSPGNFVKSFTVTTGKGEKYALKIRGFISPEDKTFLKNRYPYANGRLRFKTKAVNFGSISDKLPVSRRAEIYNYTDSTVTFTGKINSAEYLKVYFDSGNVIGPGEIGALYFVFDPVLKNEVGFFNESAELFIDDPAAPRLIVPVSVHVRGIPKIAESTTDTLQKTEEIVPEEEPEKPEPKAAAEMPDRPVIRLSESRQNLGLVRSGIKTVTEFVLHNDGAKPLIIHNIQADKGILVLSDAAFSVPAGGQKVIKIRFNSEGFLGKITAGFSVFSNDPKNAELKVEIAAEITE